MDYGCVYQLVLLDLSTAFDTIDHKILLNRLENYFCIHGIVLSWFKSYLSDRHQFVALNEEVSYRSQVQYGAPQGSSTRTIAFQTLLPLGDIIRKHGVSFHCYADDTQLFISSYQFAKVTECIDDIQIWITSIVIWLNSKKNYYKKKIIILLIIPKTSLRNNQEHCLSHIFSS